MEDKAQRLAAAYEYLRSKGKAHTQKDVASAMNANETNVSYAFNGNSKYLTDRFLERFNTAFNGVFQIDWLSKGEGEMLSVGNTTQTVSGRGILISGGNNRNFGNRDVIYGYRGDYATETRNDDEREANTNEPYTLVPVYNFDAVGGTHSSNDITDSPAYVERRVPFAGATQGDICVHVTGNSMAPTYCSGALLLVREVHNWAEYFGYGHSFVIFLKDGRRILKEVQRFTANPQEYVLCVSHNNAYPPEELPRSMISAVYKVIMTQTNEGF